MKNRINLFWSNKYQSFALHNANKIICFKENMFSRQDSSKVHKKLTNIKEVYHESI